MINCIVAVEKNHGIGFNGQMPWPKLKEDMKWFRSATNDQIVIMGRKTWESLGSKKLPNRYNVVISTSNIVGADLHSRDPLHALNFCCSTFPKQEIYIIGGSAIYAQYMSKIDRFYVTEINAEYECDTFFDLNYVKNNFHNVKEIASFEDPLQYTIKEYT